MRIISYLSWLQCIVHVFSMFYYLYVFQIYVKCLEQLSVLALYKTSYYLLKTCFSSQVQTRFSPLKSVPNQSLDECCETHVIELPLNSILTLIVRFPWYLTRSLNTDTCGPPQSCLNTPFPTPTHSHPHPHPHTQEVVSVGIQPTHSTLPYVCCRSSASLHFTYAMYAL